MAKGELALTAIDPDIHCVVVRDIVRNHWALVVSPALVYLGGRTSKKTENVRADTYGGGENNAQTLPRYILVFCA